jgi:hypothetical protein
MVISASLASGAAHPSVRINASRAVSRNFASGTRANVTSNEGQP